MRVISLGIAELDRDLGGGIPHPSLISIEGEYGSGKTIFIQQIASAMLKEGLRVYVISSEATVKEYLSMMKSVRLDVDNYYLSGKLNIYPLHVEGGRWNDFLSSFFLRVASNFLELKKELYDAVIIDSLSVLTVNTPASEFLTFVTRMKNLVSDEKTVIATFHPEFLSEESIMKLRASSDVYLVLKNASISGIDVKILRVVKLWGVSGERKSAITLEINPQIGLRVMPLSGVKV
ncbi:MAG: ATPase domain-containing protein [Nitrososphaerota archaeon]|nr:flagellar accessory protein FlaH [Candidatus Bathyarchaeota archaeon]MDW8023095.1 ATPase domain-containing protein [Nitrososphaerota archaeon]